MEFSLANLTPEQQRQEILRQQQEIRRQIRIMNAVHDANLFLARAVAFVNGKS